MTAPFLLTRGSSPLLISFPHVGTFVPEAIRSRLSPAAQSLPDTDWLVDELYDFAGELNATTLVASHSRYVVDLNRSDEGGLLYPGQNETAVVPLTLFDGAPLYAQGDEPSDAELAWRIDTVWRPYHEALKAEIARLKALHGRVLLWDAHSILTQVPRLFDGDLPELNLGTNSGASCRPGLGEALFEMAGQSPYSVVLNGRFKGGYITRKYGSPQEGVDAVQLELAQHTYMNDARPEIDETRAQALRPVLRRLIAHALDFCSGRT